MLGLIVALITITAILLVLVVLAQNSKGGGLSSQFGGSGSSQLMGVKRTTDLLEKITWGFALALVVLTLATNLIIGPETSEGLSSPNIDAAQERTVLPSLEQDLGGADDSGNLLGTDSTGQ
jgi:preprotein translocase subunit SecG